MANKLTDEQFYAQMDKIKQLGGYNPLDEIDALNTAEYGVQQPPTQQPVADTSILGLMERGEGVVGDFMGGLLGGPASNWRNNLQQDTNVNPYVAGKDVLNQANVNFLDSAKTSLGGGADLVANPKQTVQSIADLSSGALQHALPDSMSWNEDDKAMASMAGQQIKEDWTTAEGFQKMLAERPAEVFPAFYGAGILGKIAGGKARDVLNSEAVLSKVEPMSRAIDPLNLGPSSKMAEDYKMTHTSPQPEGKNSLDDFSETMPDSPNDPNFARYYGMGGEYSKADAETIAVMKTVQGNPDAEVTIYRAVPKGVKDINAGDWVSTSKDYANRHGDSHIEGGYDLIEKKVRAGDLNTDGDLHEWGYNPSKADDGVLGQVGKSLYHGTDADLDLDNLKTFAGGDFGEGVYFAEDVADASEYGKKIYKADVDLKNPLVLDTRYQMNGVWDEFIGNKTSPDQTINDYLKEQGYDGITVKNPGMGDDVKKPFHIAFDKSAVKSFERSDDGVLGQTGKETAPKPNKVKDGLLKQEPLTVYRSSTSGSYDKFDKSKQRTSTLGKGVYMFDNEKGANDWVGGNLQKIELPHDYMEKSINWGDGGQSDFVTKAFKKIEKEVDFKLDLEDGGIDVYPELVKKLDEDKAQALLSKHGIYGNRRDKELTIFNVDDAKIISTDKKKPKNGLLD